MDFPNCVPTLRQETFVHKTRPTPYKGPQTLPWTPDRSESRTGSSQDQWYVIVIVLIICH